MAPVFLVILLVSGVVAQVAPPATPTAPSAATPAGAPLPEKARRAPSGAASEMEGDTKTKEDGVMSFSKYEGGSFSMKPNKVTTYVNEREVVVVQGKQRFAIPVKAIAEVSDGSGAYGRVGTATGSQVPNSSPKNNATVVGIVWQDQDKKNGVVLRLDKGDFSAFVSALETVTGLKAIDTGAK